MAELEKAQEDVEVFIYRKIPEALERSESEIKKYQSSINELVNEKRDVETKVNKLKEDIHRQEVRKRELSDNIVYRKTEDSVKSLQQECSSLADKLESINHAQITNEWRNLRTREQALLRQVYFVRNKYQT